MTLGYFSDNSVFFCGGGFCFLFLTTISTNTSINLFSNNLLSVGYYVCVFGIVNQIYIFLVQPGLFQERQGHYPCGRSQISPSWYLRGNSAFLVSLKTLHSRRRCFDCAGRFGMSSTVVCCSCLSIKRVRKSAVTNTQSRYCLLALFAIFERLGCHSSQKGFDLKLFYCWYFLFQRCWHFFMEENYLFSVFRSVYGMLYFSGVKSKADFAAASCSMIFLSPQCGLESNKRRFLYLMLSVVCKVVFDNKWVL